MSRIQFDVNVAKLLVWWKEAYPFRVDQSKSLLNGEIKYDLAILIRTFAAGPAAAALDAAFLAARESADESPQADTAANKGEGAACHTANTQGEERSQQLVNDCQLYNYCKAIR